MRTNIYKNIKQPPQCLGLIPRSSSQQQVKTLQIQVISSIKPCLSSIESDNDITPAQQEFLQMLNGTIKNNFSRMGLKQEDFNYDEEEVIAKPKKQVAPKRFLKMQPIICREADNIEYQIIQFDEKQEKYEFIDYSSLPEQKQKQDNFKQITKEDWIRLNIEDQVDVEILITSTTTSSKQNCNRDLDDLSQLSDSSISTQKEQ